MVGRLSLGGSLDRRPNAEQSAFRTGGALLGDSACGVGNSFGCSRDRISVGDQVVAG